MSKKPIKSSLFRFVTLRSPQAIEDIENAPGLIVANSAVKSASAYYQATNGIIDNTARETALKGVDSSTSFALINSKAEIKTAVSGSLESIYNFSLWLAKNKNKLSYELLVNKLPSDYLNDTSEPFNQDITLSPSDETTVWDNLLYQTINKVSVSLRESLIQLLITNSLIKAFKAYYDEMNANLGEGEIVLFTDEDEKEFKKRANASIIIEKRLVLNNNLSDVNPIEDIPETVVNSLNNELDSILAKDRIGVLKNALVELEKEEKVYEIENEKQLEIYAEQHRTSVKTLIDAETPTLVTITNPDTQANDQVETYPDLTLPKFDYIPITIDFQSDTGPFAKSTSSESNLSLVTKSLLKEGEFSSYTEFSSLKSTLKESIKEQEEIIFEAASTTKKATTGSAIHNIVEDYCFTGNLERKLILSNGIRTSEFALNLLIVTNRNNSAASNITYSLTKDADGTIYNGTGEEFVNNSNKKLLYKMPIAMSNSDLSAGMFTFNATMTFENGDVVIFNTKIVVSKLDAIVNLNLMKFVFRGCGQLQNGSSNTNNTSSSLNGIINLGVADYRRVEQEVCCYVPGEVSHIENIMKGEFKERTNKTLKRTENTFTFENERTTEQLNDTTSTERYEMNQETSEIISEDSSFDLGVTFNASGLNTSLSVNSNYATATSTQQSDQQATSYAKEVTERALERITERVREERVAKIIEEYQEENKHSLDNSNGDSHLVGLYRWVDKVYKNKVVNYGKRLMYEFNIPQPAAYYLNQKANDNEFINTSIEPIDPRSALLPNGQNNPKRIATHKNLDTENHDFWVSKYNISNDVAPSLNITLSKKHVDSQWTNDGRFQKAGDFSIDIPKGYYVKSVKGYFDPHHGNSNATFRNMEGTILIGGTKIDVPAYTKFQPINLSLENKKISEKLEVSLTSWDIGIYNFNLTVECQLLNSVFETWQKETFNKIIEVYLDEKSRYDIALTELQQNDSSLFSISGTNPQYYREVEQTELKKNCIYMMAGKDAIGKEFLAKFANDEIVPQNNNQYGAYASFVTFMEQAFDWKLMTYIFRPYFWAGKEKWTDLQQLEDNDPTFKAFLRAGIAKAVVPVRLGFEKAVMHYLETGELWDGGDSPVIDDELYTSIVDELQIQEGDTEGDTWETRVPTSLTILQAKNAALADNGLPCYCDGFDIEGLADGVNYDTIGEDNTVV